MAETSEISWTDATFNPWIGCTKVSPGCDHCYAERDNGRRKWVPGWGPGVPRKRTKTWDEPLKWERAHDAFFASTGRHRRVFCASLADVFDKEVPIEWRVDLFRGIRKTPNLRWLILTKRIGNAAKMLPEDFDPMLYPHVAIGATMVNQDEYDRDYEKLMAIPAAMRFISMEPMLSHIWLGGDLGAPDWIITGGESGPRHRPLDMNWVRSMRDQCEGAGIPFHHKQNGGLRGKDGGCLVDGVEHKAFPEFLR